MKIIGQLWLKMSMWKVNGTIYDRAPVSRECVNWPDLTISEFFLIIVCVSLRAVVPCHYKVNINGFTGKVPKEKTHHTAKSQNNLLKDTICTSHLLFIQIWHRCDKQQFKGHKMINFNSLRGLCTAASVSVLMSNNHLSCATMTTDLIKF